MAKKIRKRIKDENWQCSVSYIRQSNEEIKAQLNHLIEDETDFIQILTEKREAEKAVCASRVKVINYCLSSMRKRIRGNEKKLKMLDSKTK